MNEEEGSELGDLILNLCALARSRSSTDEALTECTSSILDLCALPRKKKGVRKRLNLDFLAEKESPALGQILTLVETTREEDVLEAALSTLNVFTEGPKKLRRLRVLVQANAVHSLAKQAIFFLKHGDSQILLDKLLSLLLTVAAKDRKAGLKFRLSGLLQMSLTEALKLRLPSPHYFPISEILLFASKSVSEARVFCRWCESFYEFIAADQKCAFRPIHLCSNGTKCIRTRIMIVASGRNAQVLGKHKDFLQWLLEVSESSNDYGLVLRNSQILFHLCRTRKNRQKLHALEAIGSFLQLFERFYKLRNTALAAEICLVILGCLRQLSKTRMGKEQLTSMRGMAVFERAVEDSFEGDEIEMTPLLRDLESSLATLCLRCLPGRPLPLPNHTFPRPFPLPSEAQSLNNTPKGGSDDSDDEEDEAGFSEDRKDLDSEEESDGGEQSERRDKEALAIVESRVETAPYQRFFPELFSDTPLKSWVDPEYNEGPRLRPRTRSSSTGKSQSPLQRRRARSDTETNNDRKPGKKAGPGGRIGLKGQKREEGSPGKGKKRDFPPSDKLAQRTKSVISFVKTTYPDSHQAFPDLPRQPLKDFPHAMKQTVLCEMSKMKSEETFTPQVVYDLDTLLKTESDDMDARLENDDLKKQALGKENPCGHLLFESRFESGNLRKVVQVDKREYDLFTSPDINQLSQHYQWFYFQVSNMQAEVPYTLNICNCLKSHSMFSSGMQPVIFSVGEAGQGRPGWVRAGQRVCYYRNAYTTTGKRGGDNRGYYTASFTVTFRHSNDICYIAYHYPYTYSYLKKSLGDFFSSITGNFYYRCETLTTSLGGNPVPVITVTGPGGLEEVRRREYVFISARVHPGETNASWMMQGTLRFLLSSVPMAEALRRHFIFKLVPMLNPDGVINGSHRCSLVGQDLNRQWSSPNSVLHPVIHHTKGLLRLLKAHGRTPWVFCDYHGHSRRFNVFVYGNNPEESWWIPDHVIEHNFAYLELPRVLSEEVPAFSMADCRFTIEKSKEPSARVVAWRQIGIPRSYTMESTYCGFDQGPYKGFQLGTRELTEMGQQFCASLLTLRKRVQAGFRDLKRSSSGEDTRDTD